MKKIVSAVALAVGTFMVPLAAQAAPTIIITGPSGTFGDDEVTCAAGTVGSCAFTRTFTFTTPAGFTLANADISSIATTNPLTNIDFTSVTLNGVAFSTLVTGQQELRNLLNQTLTAGGSNSLLVSGTTGGNAAFSGNLSFAAVQSAVPEPSTWAMMLVGFGFIGSFMRRRTGAPQRRVSFG